MHDTSLVRSLLKQVERLADEHGGATVTQIEVEIGPLSGVEPLLVREAFDLLVTGTGVAGAALVMKEVALMARCRDCQAEFPVEGFLFRCTNCSSRSVSVTQGDAFRLLNLTLEATQPEEAPARRP